MAAFDKPRTKAMAAFLVKEAHRVTGLSIEADGVFIYTESASWCDDSGSGTFRADSETAAIKAFYARVQPAQKSGPEVQTLTAHGKTVAKTGMLAQVNIRSDAMYFTVYAWNGRPIGTITRPFPGYPHHRKDWQVHDTEGRQLPGIIVGPRGGLMKITRNHFEGAKGVHVLPELESIL